jgi:hypothetical protein
MKYINISNNHLYSINSVLSLFCERIDASNNHINKCVIIPANYHKYIDLSHNSISNIIIEGNDHMMTYLNISHNNLTNSHFLLLLHKLQVLDVSHNHITTINHYFRNLLKLNVSHNLLNRFYINNFISSVNISHNYSLFCDNSIYRRCNFLDVTDNNMIIDMCKIMNNSIIEMKCGGNIIINENIIKFFNYLKNYTSNTLEIINYYIDNGTELQYEYEFFYNLHYDTVELKMVYNVYINDDNNMDTFIIKNQESIDIENEYNNIFKCDRLIRLYYY